MKLKIVQVGDRVLRQPARPLTPDEIRSGSTQQLIELMRETMRDAPGVGLMLLVFHDLTPQHRVEEMRVDFVANASHELRTPLASLSGFIDTLQGPARDDPNARGRFLAIMKTQAARMARLIDDLLSLSRIELVEHVHPDTPVDLTPVLRQVVDGLQTLAQDRQKFRDAFEHGQHLLPAHKGIQANTKVRIGRQPSANTQREPDLRAAANRRQSDIVNLRIRAPNPASRDRYFELARQIVEVGIS